jgi:hypothetical protein
MVAVFEVTLDTGGMADNPGLSTNTDTLGPPNVRYKRADDPTIDTIDPNIIPSAGTTNSRWKSLYLLCITAPDTQVNNVKIYTDGVGFGTGITVNVGDETPTKNSASDAWYDPADTNDDPLTNHDSITGVTDFFTFTSGSPKTVSISEAGNIIDAINETTDYVVSQMDVINTATPGDLANETITWEWDEI